MPKLSRALALESIVRDVAREVILPQFLHVARQYKEDGSTVTQIDLAAQQALVARLPEVIEAPVIGEEMPVEEQVQHWHAGTQGVWCIDPIDGTTNFSNGMPAFAVSVAYLVAGETQFGVVYEPMTDSSFCAARGAGAWLNGNRLPLRQASPSLSKAVAGIDFKRLKASLATRLVTAPPYFSQRSFGSSSLEWCYVAAGRLDVYLHGAQALWDYAAGRLILEEAGGVFGLLDGSPLLADPLAKRAVVLASNQALYDEWLSWLQK